MANQPITPPVVPPGIKPIAPPTVPSAPGIPGAPPMAAKMAPVPPGVKPAAPGQQPPPGQGEGDEEGQEPRLTFWQQPWVQNILPFVTSLSVHAGIVIIAALVVVAVKVVQKLPQQDQVIIPDSNMVENGPPGGIPNLGLNNDPLREAMQNNDPSSKTKEWAEQKGPQVDIQDTGEKGDTDATLIAPGSMGNPGNPNGNGHSGHGTGDASGPLAAFGPPGGGGIGPKGPVFGAGGNARKIVFLCDATGSMINKMATLKDELNKAVTGLKPVQSFDIIFYQDVKVEPMAPAMIPATPESKRKAGNYLDGVTATGTTDPVPALTKALQLKPQLLYFLTDAADFPDKDAVLDAIKKNNADHKIKINTILFVENHAEHEKNADSESLMQQIAKDSGGNFRWVEMDAIQ